MSRGTLDPAGCIRISRTRLSLSLAGFPKTILLSSYNTVCSPNPGMHASRFGLFPVRSPLLRKSHVVFSSSGYLDVSVHRVPSAQLWIHCTATEVFSARFPHSDISGSMDMCSSPKLFAAYHVFHRLLVPRHPPYALSSITNLPLLTGWSKGHTCIALHALVISQFLYRLFSSDLVNVVNNITSDVSIKILSFIFYFFICSFQGT